MKSDDSESVSYAAQFLVDAHSGDKKLIYSYINTPGAAVREDSAIHNGTALITISEKNNTIELSGNYWTDRKSTGELNLKRRQAS